MKAINKNMAKGAFWMILLRFAVRGIGLISTVFLARLLIPTDFGLVAMAMSIIGAVELLGAFSLDVTLINNQNAGRNHYDTAWTLNILAALIQGLLLFAVAPWVAHFYSDHRLILIIQLLALGTLIQGFENIGIVAFRKDLEFHKDFNFQLAKKIISFVVTMAMAFWLRNYWALIGGMLVSRFMGVLFSFLLQPYRPKLSLAVKNELFHFSKWLFINNLLFFANHQSASFILGKITGANALGLFSLSYEISNLPSTDLVAPINRAIFPGYAKMAHDLEMLRQGYLNVFSAIALVALPVCTGIALVADPLVHVMLGEKWLATIPLIQILAIAGLTQSLQTNKGSVFLALGRPRLLTLLAVFHAATLLPALVWGAMQNGVMGAAYATVIVSLLLMPVNFLILSRILHLRFASLLAVFWRPAIASLVMIAAVSSVETFTSGGSTFISHLTQLVILTLAGSLTYAASILLLWKVSGMKPGMEALVLDKLSSRYRAVFVKE
ncbi:MAG TPA: lipopolysaccharide biosynthesis protein [Burkholderiales bacterium]|nr:lipopolysaccharide biosynthesis protein [Burkholderiales bacterium]